MQIHWNIRFGSTYGAPTRKKYLWESLSLVWSSPLWSSPCQYHHSANSR